MTTALDHPLRLTETERGAFLRREVLALGLDDRAIREEVRAGRWVRVRHGAYCFADTWQQAGDEGRHLITARAVARSHPGRIAMSHQTACLLHGLDLWDVPLDRVHVTRLDRSAGRTEPTVVHHEGLCTDADLTEVSGLAVTRPVRAVLETASGLDVEHGLVIADSLLRSGLATPEDLAAQLALMRWWPGSQHLELVARLADGASESAGESRGRFLFWMHGLPTPVLQYEVYAGTRLVGRTDFAWPERGLLGEFDGRVKYGRKAPAGLTPGEVVFREKRREDEIRRLTGFRFVRLTWADLYDGPRVAAMVRRMLAA